MEPRYVDDPFVDEEDYAPQMPKWRMPSTDFQTKILGAVGLRYFPEKHNGGKGMRSKIIEIERSLMSLSSGVDSVYPTEWVDEVIDWFRAKKDFRGARALLGLLRQLGNQDWRDRTVARWHKEHPVAKYSDEIVAPDVDAGKWSDEIHV